MTAFLYPALSLPFEPSAQAVAQSSWITPQQRTGNIRSPQALQLTSFPRLSDGGVFLQILATTALHGRWKMAICQRARRSRGLFHIAGCCTCGQKRSQGNYPVVHALQRSGNRMPRARSLISRRELYRVRKHFCTGTLCIPSGEEHDTYVFSVLGRLIPESCKAEIVRTIRAIHRLCAISFKNSGHDFFFSSHN